MPEDTMTEDALLKEWGVRVGRMTGFTLCLTEFRKEIGALEQRGERTIAGVMRGILTRVESSEQYRKLVAEKDEILRQVDPRRLPPT